MRRQQDSASPGQTSLWLLPLLLVGLVLGGTPARAATWLDSLREAFAGERPAATRQATASRHDAATAGLGATPHGAQAGERVALVIGNARYQDLRPLRNPGQDAAAIADRLQALGFTLIGKDGQDAAAPLRDLDETGFSKAVRAFAKRAEGAEMALLYYAGHGMQIAGEPFLLPVDVPRDDLELLRRNSIGLEGILRRLDGQAGLTVAVFDACREIPELESAVQEITRATGLGANQFRGLPIVQSQGRARVIAYSGAAGQLVKDGDGRHSPYTDLLLEHLKQPHESIDDTFQRVAYEFGQRQGGQHPEILIQGVPPNRYFFRPPPAITPPVTAPLPPPPAMRGYLQVSATVPASVTVNGRAVGQVRPGRPLNLTQGLPVGEFEVRVSASGYPSQARRVQIPANDWAQAHFVLVREAPVAPPVAERPGELVVRSNVAGDTWTLDGQPMGPTGPDVHEIPAGEHRILVEKDGHEPFEERVTLAAGERRTVRATLKGIHQPFEPELTRIPAGCFQMGSPPSEWDRDDNERRHRVCVEGFGIGKYEVTQAQWRAVMGNNPSKFSGCDDCPVEKVSWNDVNAYIGKLNARTGKRYRLPTEAEWEYAARAGSETAYWWGEGVGRNRANCNGCGSRWDNERTAPVGSFAANRWGLYDTAGNVYEWTCSAWDAGYGGGEQRCANKNHSGRVASRGGAWYGLPRWVRSAHRGWNSASNRNDNVGFRLAQD